MLRKVFSMSLNVHALIAIIVLVLAETIGLWFLNTYMNFPANNLNAANWVYQGAIITFIIQIMQVPYQAAIISNEKMSFYAYLSIIEVCLKLSAVLLLGCFSADKLQIYACILCVVSLLIWCTYRYYCMRKFDMCTYKRAWDTKLFKELTSFSGWNMLGGLGNVGASQGVNILFNIFCGVVVNAAWGIANQVTAAVSGFVGNFQTAFNPQIIKYYASGERNEFQTLLFRASRLSFLLIFIIGFPIMVCAPWILRTWLTSVPDYAVTFTRYMIAFCMIDAYSGPLWIAAQASGRIKNYMLIIATLILLNVPLAFCILKFGLSPIWVVVCRTIMNFIVSIVRIGYLHFLIDFPAMMFVRKVLIPISIYILGCIPLPLILYQSINQSWEGNVITILMSVIISALLGLFILLNKGERQAIFNRLRTLLHLTTQ